MKVSIIIAVYRAEKYIEKCLQSVASQTYDGDIECLIIDDRGGDRSIEIAEQFIQSFTGRFEFKIIKHEKNLGASASRNTGIDNATGEYFYFLDNDDTITPDCIEKLTAPLKQKKYDFVQGNFQVEGGTTGIQQLHLNTGEYADREFIIYGYTHSLWPLTLWNKLLNLEFVKRHHLYFEDLIAEDNVWSLDLACCVNSMYAVQDITYHYLIQEDSIMRQLGKNWNKVNKDHLTLLQYLVDRQDRSVHIRNYVIHFGNALLQEAFEHNCLSLVLYKDVKRISKPTPFASFLKRQSSMANLIFNMHFNLPSWFGYLIKRMNLCLFKR